MKVTTLKDLNLYTHSRITEAEFNRHPGETWALRGAMVLIGLSVLLPVCLIFGGAVKPKVTAKEFPAEATRRSKGFRASPTSSDWVYDNTRYPKVLDCWKGEC